jgi:hypothetical protein
MFARGLAGNVEAEYQKPDNKPEQSAKSLPHLPP